VLHVLVDDAAAARAALEGAGLEVRDDREVVILSRLAHEPGTLGAALRKFADANVNLDLMYIGQDGSIVVGGTDLEGLRQASSVSRT
jgi:hypothetical protein